MNPHQRAKHVSQLQRDSARMDQTQELLSAARDGLVSEVLRWGELCADVLVKCA